MCCCHIVTTSCTRNLRRNLALKSAVQFSPQPQTRCISLILYLFSHFFHWPVVVFTDVIMSLFTVTCIEKIKPKEDKGKISQMILSLCSMWHTFPYRVCSYHCLSPVLACAFCVGDMLSATFHQS